MRLGLLALILIATSVCLIAAGWLHFATFVVSIAGLTAALLASVDVARTAVGWPDRWVRLGRRLVIVIALMVLALETLLRAANIYTSYLERGAGGSFVSTYQTGLARPMGATWFHVYLPGITVTYDRVEFRTTVRTNSLGLCDRELPPEKAPGEIRVVALGDSFTEGVGAPAEAAWPRVLETTLNSREEPRRAVVANAGIGGSDPWYEYILLREKLLDPAPDLVVVAINSSDINDVMLRGGVERFQPDGSTKFARTPPRWEWLYGLSYLARHVVHDVMGYDFLFVRDVEVGPLRLWAVDRILEAVRAFMTLGRDRGFDLIVVTHPNSNEALYDKYDDAMQRLVDAIGAMSGLQSMDLLEQWRPIVAARGMETFFWPIDGHNNPEGYALFAATVARRLDTRGLMRSSR